MGRRWREFGAVVRRWLGPALVLGTLLLAACSEPEPTPDATADADAVFTDLMDENAPGWQEQFAVQGATVDDAPTLATLAARETCTQLATQPVDGVLANLLTGALPPETAGTLLYAATVAYCPDYTQAVQDFAEANR